MSSLISVIGSTLRRKINTHKTKGGKRARRAEVARIERFVDWCNCPPEQIGRKHVHLFFEEKRFAPTTARDYFYAISKLWKMLGRSGEPPRPKDHNPG